MSDSEDKILHITAEGLEEKKRNCESFLLCFLTSERNHRSLGYNEACYYYCKECPLIQWYNIDIESFLSAKNSGLKGLRYNVFQYVKGQEVKSVSGGRSEELHKLVVSLQRELEMQQGSSQDNNPSEGSEKAVLSSSGPSVTMIPKYTQKISRRRKGTTHTSKRHIVVHTTTRASTSSVLPIIKSKGAAMAKYQLTEKGLDLISCVNRPPECILCPFIAQPSTQKCTVQDGGTISSSSSGRSTPTMPKSPILKVPSPERVFQISPASSVESLVSGRTARRSRSSTPDPLSGESRFLFLSSSSSSSESTGSARTPPRSVNSPTKSRRSSREQSPIITTSPPVQQISVIQYAPRPINTSVIQGPTRKIHQYHANQQTPHHHHPTGSQHHSQRRTPPHLQQQTVPSRPSLLQRRLHTVIRGPNTGGHHTHPYPPNQ